MIFMKDRLCSNDSVDFAANRFEYAELMLLGCDALAGKQRTYPEKEFLVLRELTKWSTEVLDEDWVYRFLVCKGQLLLICCFFYEINYCCQRCNESYEI